jgi:hypothetical protein
VPPSFRLALANKARRGIREVGVGDGLQSEADVRTGEAVATGDGLQAGRELHTIIK